MDQLSPKKVLLGCTGSVATIKLIDILNALCTQFSEDNIEVRVVLTENAARFVKAVVSDGLLQIEGRRVCVFQDKDEWSTWTDRGDPVMHIELGKWADLLLIAPLDANTLAKIAMGLCDNLLTCVVRAWGSQKPVVFCPAMNTRMWDHPVTSAQLATLCSWGYIEVPCTSKTLMCGDTGIGAMADINTIVNAVHTKLSS